MGEGSRRGFAVFDQVKVGGAEEDFHVALTLRLAQCGALALSHGRGDRFTDMPRGDV